MWRALIVALALLALLVAGCSPGPPSQRDPIERLAWLHTPFKVRAGDDAAWSAPDLDDTGWQEVDSRLLPGTTLDRWAGVAWFRGSLDVPPELTGRPVPMYGRFVGGAEVFIDGEPAFDFGDPDDVARTGSTPVDFAMETPRWVTFTRAGAHPVAVRFASRHLDALHRIGFPGGFELALAAEPLPPRPGRGLAHAFLGATAALASLHLLLFAFHRDRRENLYYALAALAVACITLFNQLLASVGTAQEAIACVGAVGAAVALSGVLLLRVYHAVFSPRLPRTYGWFFAAALVVALASFWTPRPIVYGFAAAMAMAQLRVLVAAIARRADGAWIIGVGGGLWLLGGAVQMLGDLAWLPRVYDAYLYGFVALLGATSVYLARDMARDKADLARKLVEVRELSARQRETMERYRTVFETTGTGMILFGDDAVVTLANEQWARLTGFGRDEVEGKLTWTTFFSDRSLEKLNAHHRLRSGDPASAPRAFEAELRDRGGKLREGVVTIGRVPGTEERVGSFLDLTELKRAQRQMIRADKMAALGQVIAGVAHEINNPNNFIHFNLPILRRYIDAMRPLLEARLDDEPDLTLLGMRYEAFIEDLFKLLDNMQHGSSRITAIVADLKNYIRGGEDLEMRVGPLEKVVEKVMALVGKQVRKMVKRVDVDVAPGLPPLRMNAGKIEQVLINLLLNAGQATDKEDSRVTLTVRKAEGGAAVELVVEDNGAGIPAESLEQIFEPFYTTKGRETGTGLGLAISQQIVEEHGGRIEVASELGRGARFTVRLPAA